MNKFVVLQSLHHEKRKIHPAGEVALQDRVANMPTPNRQALALAFLEIAAPHDRPAGIAGEYLPAGLHLIVDVHRTKEFAEAAENLHFP